MIKQIFTLSLFAPGTAAGAQTKIGGTPGPADANAYLQLGDSTAANKGGTSLYTSSSLGLEAHYSATYLK